MKKATSSLSDSTSNLDTASNTLSTVANTLNTATALTGAARQLGSLSVDTNISGIKVTVNINGNSQETTTDGVANVKTKMTGPVAAKGGIVEGGNTLVGELGPELRVSNGKYEVIGENGA